MPHDSETSHGAACERPRCYGTLFPSVLALREGGSASGTVFKVTLERAGGMWRSNRSVTADFGQWDGCLQCDAFEDCYRLSMAKLALEAAVQDR